MWQGTPHCDITPNIHRQYDLINKYICAIFKPILLNENFNFSFIFMMAKVFKKFILPYKTNQNLAFYFMYIY